LLLSPPSAMPRPKLLWRAKGVWVGRRPAVEGGQLFVTTPDASQVVAIDVLTGKELWRTAVPSPASRRARWDWECTTADCDKWDLDIVGTRVLFSSSGGVAAFDRGSGAVRWARSLAFSTFEESSKSGSNIAGINYSGRWDGTNFLTLLDLETGRTRWRLPMARSPDNDQLLAAGPERLYLSHVEQKAEGRPRLRAYARASGRLVFDIPLPTGLVALRSIPGDPQLLVGLNEDETLVGLRASDGVSLWRFDLGKRFAPFRWHDKGVAISDGHLLLTEIGQTSEFDVRTGRIARTWPLPSVGWSPGQQSSARRLFFTYVRPRYRTERRRQT
jgi:outer membrane protein assembly factor BamB